MNFCSLSIAILSFSANIGAYNIYLGTLSGLSDPELGLKGSKKPLDIFLQLYGDSKIQKSTFRTVHFFYLF